MQLSVRVQNAVRFCTILHDLVQLFITHTVFCTMRYDFCTSLHDLIRSCTMQYCVVRICCANLNDSARLEGAWGGNWNLWQVLVGIYSPICGRTLLYLSKTYLGRSWKVPKGCQNGTKIQPKRYQNGSDKGPYGVHGCQNASRGVQELQISKNLRFSYVFGRFRAPRKKPVLAWEREARFILEKCKGMHKHV